MKNIKSQQGVGLIEVLITVLVLSTALMALAALQTRSLQYNTSAYYRSQANIVAYNALEQMRSSSTLENIVQPDMDELVESLPGGDGEIECQARVCTVSISWDEPVAEAGGEEVERTTFGYTSRI
ncbi:type IV pilus modification protein PilV [Gilvimarinus japonicus]|uniref:Type IV pilus modification protein PilV n=1 Tax=Gilvimarinus japonicus TaxID=1796469 RepID=A0ABV7HYM0_9GAMM